MGGPGLDDENVWRWVAGAVLVMILALFLALGYVLGRLL
jgi:hypothetical protein